MKYSEITEHFATFRKSDTPRLATPDFGIRIREPETLPRFIFSNYLIYIDINFGTLVAKLSVWHQLPLHIAYEAKQLRMGRTLPRFVTRPNGEILDRQTGLIWLNGHNEDITWAQNRCRIVNLHIGKQHWRMPTENELLELNEAPLEGTPFNSLIGKCIWTCTMETSNGTATSVRLGSDNRPRQVSILCSKDMRGLAIKTN